VHLLALLTRRYRGACALIVQRLQRRYGEAKRGREGIEEFGDRVAKGVEREQLGTPSDRPGDDRLTEDDFDLGEASLSKDLLDGLCKASLCCKVKSLQSKIAVNTSRAEYPKRSIAVSRR